MTREELLKHLDELSEQPTTLDDICWDPQPRMTPYGLQDDNGVDVDLIRFMLRMSPQERLRFGEAESHALERLRKNAKRIA